ncbi:MAG: UDP-glucose--hexose-1-phosphate uridylyltransferase [Atopobiaceae bacterium]
MQDMPENELVAAAEGICDYAAVHGLMGWEDRIWAYNSVLAAVGATGPGPDDGWALAEDAEDAHVSPSATSEVPDKLLATLAEHAIAAGKEENTASGRDRIAMEIMGRLMPRPSAVSKEFRARAKDKGPKEATDWFYGLCCDAGYVRRSAIARNICWTHESEFGPLEITINLSKPEKDPREIAAAGKAPAGEKYPACQLCIENEGYPGRPASDAFGAHPARQNLRIIPIELGGERWGFQYSPYAYFNEHCIAMSAHHRPMHVDRASLSCLLDFVDLFPHYFIGSNADLPIVGGSILSHDHYQGGRHEFAMMKAETAEEFALPGYPAIKGEVLKWPLSVLRLTSESRDDVLDAADHIISCWREWDDPSLGIVSHDREGAHNTVTPIVRKHEGAYEVYLALRCNITSKEHPLGVFHPHEQWHHIKRENIGLIEVMGLAILPPRLVPELRRTEELLIKGATAEELEQDSLSASHAVWAEELAARHPELSEDNVSAIVKDGVGEVFSHVLEDAGVFKWDESGRAGQDRFIQSL